MNKPFLTSALAIGLPLAVVATLVLAISYINDQQTIRMFANEPQEYVARDSVLRVIASGGLPTSGFQNAIPIESDPAAYVVFFDASGKAVAGTGVLKGQPPTLPAGVLEEAKSKGVNRLTWEPEAGVRQAIVVIPAGDGYVMSGRSLTYAEEQESMLGKRALIGWLGTMVAIAIVALITAWFKRKRGE